MSKIYHYTKINTLEAILKSRTIRFNRLDNVDDEEEYIWGSGEKNILMGKYVFVSCWTKETEEICDLWKRYGDYYKGVRIGMEDSPFVEYAINDHFLSYFLQPYYIIDDCVLHLPFNEVKLYDIQYVDDNIERIKNLIEINKDCITAKTRELGIYKKRKWNIQKECRFKLVAFPFSTDNLNDPTNILMSSIRLTFDKNKDITPTYIAIDLKKEVLNTMDVTMGPLTTDEDKKRVKELLKKHTSSNIFRKRVHNSSLIM